MLTFEYTIKDPVGIHARPAGLLVKLTSSLSSNVTIESEGKKADAKRIIALMSLGVKQGQTVKLTLEGENEAEDLETLKKFLEENL